MCPGLTLVMTVIKNCPESIKKEENRFIYYERTTFNNEDVPNAANYLFDLRVESGMEKLQYLIVSFGKLVYFVAYMVLQLIPLIFIVNLHMIFILKIEFFKMICLIYRMRHLKRL